MSRSNPKTYARLLLVTAFAVAAPRWAWATDARSETRYPDYDVRHFCHSEASARPTERRHQCEDR